MSGEARGDSQRACAIAVELGAGLTKAGAVRLDAALKQLRFDRPCETYFREELVTAIRKFAVMTGDLELEAGCDARLVALAAGVQEQAHG